LPVPAGPSAKIMSRLASWRMYSACIAVRGTIVLRRVRIMIGGPLASPVMMPSSVGSLDIAISASIVPEVELLTREQPLVHRHQHLAGAGDLVLVAFDDDLVAARGDQHAEPVLDLYEVGVELAEQRSQHRLLVEPDFGARPARCVPGDLPDGLAPRFARRGMLCGPCAPFAL
jgi:hypothetical protein